MADATPAPVPTVIEYIAIEPKIALLGSLSPKEIADFTRDIILQAQGEAIQFFEDMPPLVAALALAATYDVATEAVFRGSGGLVLLFDHKATKTLRPKEVDERVWKEILIEKEKDIIAKNAPASEATIELSKVWGRACEQNGFIACAQLFIKLLVRDLRPNTVLHLRGEIPRLPLLLAVYLVRPYGRTIDYTDDADRNVILFS